MIKLDDGRRLPAAHVNWTAPAAAGRVRSGAGVDVRRLLPPFEVVTMLHSARAWERHHGPVDLYTDQDGYRWLTHWGLEDLYRAIDLNVLASVDHKLYDPSTYYTLGKVFALAASNTALTWLDTDLYLHRPIENLGGEVFVVAHREAVGNVVYPTRDRLPDPNGIVEDGWDFRRSAANTALAYFGSAVHRDAFVRSCLAFAARNHTPIEGYDPRPAFAEQRVSVFEAASLGVPVRCVVDTVWDPAAREWDPVPTDAASHHTWREKKRLARNPVAARAYLQQEVICFISRFPDDADRISRLAERGLFDSICDAADVYSWVDQAGALR